METTKFTVPTVPHISGFGFSNVNLSFFINRPVLSIILVLFFVGYAIVSLVLMYHWSRYGMKSKGIVVAHTLFISVSLVLFGASGLALYYF